MSIVKQNRLWQSIPTRSETNILTGEIKVYAPGEGAAGTDALLFSSKGSAGDWDVPSRQVLARIYNNNNKTNVGADSLERSFLTEEYRFFDNDRAAAINNAANFTSYNLGVKTQQRLAEQGVPLVKNPITGNTNSSKGVGVDVVDTSAVDVSTEVNFNTLGTVAEVEVNHSTDIFRYPLGRLPNLGYDFIEIRAYEYDAGDIRTSGKGSPRETFILPMQPSLEETNSTGWGDDRMNFLQAEASQLAVNLLNNAASGEGFMKQLGNAGQMTKDAIDRLITNPDNKAALIGYFAGQAAQTNVLARAGGNVINPNLELLFKGPALRSFQFNFKLRPRDPDEAAVIRDMIRAFKKNMNPRRSTGNIFLKTPSIFTLKYTRNGSDHPFMNKIGDCALQNFKVNYTPDGNYMTYDDGSMTGYDISLQFSELFPVYADEQDSAGGTGK